MTTNPKIAEAIEAAARAQTQVGDVLRELYASEINVSFESFWDSGVHWKIGDRSNGFIGSGTAEDWDSAVFEAADYAAGYHEYSGFNAWWFSGARVRYWPKLPEPGSGEMEKSDG